MAFLRCWALQRPMRAARLTLGFAEVVISPPIELLAVRGGRGTSQARPLQLTKGKRTGERSVRAEHTPEAPELKTASSPTAAWLAGEGDDRTLSRDVSRTRRAVGRPNLARRPTKGRLGTLSVHNVPLAGLGEGGRRLATGAGYASSFALACSNSASVRSPRSFSSLSLWSSFTGEPPAVSRM